MYKSFSIEIGGKTLTVDVGRVAAQANGAALMHYGDTVVSFYSNSFRKAKRGN